MQGRNAPLNIELQTPSGMGLPVGVSRVKLRRSGDRLSECRAVFTVDDAAYRRIDAEGLFRLAPEVRRNGGNIAFNPARLIEVEARLAADAQHLLTGHDSTPEEVQSWLQGLAASKRPHVLLKSESWIALQVVQEVPLPPELAGGAVKQGYSTIWANPAPHDAGLARDENGAGEMFDVIVTFAKDSGWPYEVVEAGSAVRVPLKGDNGEWLAVIMAEEGLNQCMVFSYLTGEVPAARRPPMAEFLTRANYGLRIGNFEMDCEDGEVRYRTSLDTAGEKLSPPMLKQLVTHNATQFDTYLPGIQAVLGGTGPVEAVEAMEAMDTVEEAE
ncbi:MAG: YbjN domain-containing protein [Dehalococcoidia bacterium]|nr:YbjN domain-containing protein [Dehalococcoidia bacterium]